MSQGDALKTVTTGEAVRPSASTWNAFIEAARSNTQQKFSAIPPGVNNGGNVIAVAQNNSGSTISRFSPCSVFGSLIDSTNSQSLPTFQSGVVCLQLLAFDATRLWVVALQDIAANQTGMVLVSGVVACQVNINHAGDTCADVQSDGTLQSASYGAATILTKPSGTGQQWCLLLVGRPSPPAVLCAQVVSLIQGGVTANPWDALKGQVITNPTTGVPDVLTLKGSYTATILPNLQVGALVEYTLQPSQGGVTACQGWLKADVFLPSSDTLPGSGMADYMVLQLKQNVALGGYQMVWDDTKLPGDITS
jgi:hypothetical protein